MNLQGNKFRIIGANEEDKCVCKKQLNYFTSVKRKLIKNKKFIFAITLFIIILILTVVCPMFAKFDYMYESADVYCAPNSKYWFGTSVDGRDLYANVWIATKHTLIIAFGVTFFNISIGLVFGGICSFYGGLIDEIIVRIIEILKSIHVIILLVIMMCTIQNQLIALIISMILWGIGNITLVTRGELLKVKEQEYILAAKALGGSTSRILCNHFFRNIFSICIVMITLEIPTIILLESSLTYLGLGVPYKFVTLATLIRLNSGMMYFYPYAVIIPSIILVAISLSLNLIGYSLRDALDPEEVVKG
ncbi:MAG: ABC transporter permease [Clostridium sp.]